MFRKALLASAVAGALTISATPLLSVASERNCLSSYERKYIPECIEGGQPDPRGNVFERALDKHDVHPFYGSNDSIRDSYEAGLQDSDELSPPDVPIGTEIGMSEEVIGNSPTILNMQSDIANNSEQIEDNSNRIDINTGRIDANSDLINENRALINNHEGRITTLEENVGNLALADAYWQASPDDTDFGEYTLVGSGTPTTWTPAINTQTSDFNQQRTISETFQRLVTEYDVNTVSGDRRVSRTYTETDLRTRTETRLVDVANNPGGGTDGWSTWSDLGGVYNCSDWSPAASRVDQGQQFSQSRQCSQRQERFIYYLPQGDSTVEKRGTRVTSVNQSQTAIGTRVTECRMGFQDNAVPGTDGPGATSNFATLQPDGTYLVWNFHNTEPSPSTNPIRFQIQLNYDPRPNNPYVRGSFEYYRGTDSFVNGARYYEICRRTR